jgi:hypothetical protein
MDIFKVKICNGELATVCRCSTACFPTVKLEAKDSSETSVLIDFSSLKRSLYAPLSLICIKKLYVLPAVFMSVVGIWERRSIIALYNTGFYNGDNVFTARYELNH